MLSNEYYKYHYICGKGHAIKLIKKQPFFKNRKKENSTTSRACQFKAQDYDSFPTTPLVGQFARIDGKLYSYFNSSWNEIKPSFSIRYMFGFFIQANYSEYVDDLQNYKDGVYERVELQKIWEESVNELIKELRENEEVFHTKYLIRESYT